MDHKFFVKFLEYLLWSYILQGDLCDKAAIEGVFDQHRFVTELVVVDLHQVTLRCSIFPACEPEWLKHLRPMQV